MKILHLGKYFYPEKGGIENYTYILAKEASKKHEVYVVVSNTSKKFKYEKIKGIKVFRLPRIFYYLHLPFTPPFVCLIKKINPDIIHLHIPNPWFEFNLFLYSLVYRKAKIVVTYHSDIIYYTFFHFLGEIFRRIYLFPLLKVSRKIIATSQNYVEGSLVLKKFKRKVKIIPLGVDTRKFKPIKVKKPKKNVLLFLGRLFPYKGLEYLLEAIKIISEKRKDFILLIVGEGKLRKKLEKLAKNLGINNFVEFTGKVSDKKAVKYYNLCDIFILPSIHKSEAFGISQLEAMACGKPVISTNLKGSGVPWVNQHMKTGLVVEPKNPQALAKAILFLLENEELRKRMGINARKRVLKYFTLEKMIRETFKSYSE
ncbi:MAG: glycosyltransferase [Candidatus Aenigmatarchaeota archaeon]